MLDLGSMVAGSIPLASTITTSQCVQLGLTTPHLCGVFYFGTPPGRRIQPADTAPGVITERQSKSAKPRRKPFSLCDGGELNIGAKLPGSKWAIRMSVCRQGKPALIRRQSRRHAHPAHVASLFSCPRLPAVSSINRLFKMIGFCNAKQSRPFDDYGVNPCTRTARQACGK